MALFLVTFGMAVIANGYFVPAGHMTSQSTSFGQSVAIDTAIVAVGSYTRLHVFYRDSDWSEATITGNPDTLGPDAVSVATNGHIILVGDPSANNNTGAVYVYVEQSQGKQWKQQHILIPQNTSRFGSCVAMNNQIIITSKESLVVYNWNGTIATLVQTIPMPSEGQISCDCDEITIVVGMHCTNTVNVFTQDAMNSNGWSLSQSLQNTDGFGNSVSVVDDTIFVGSNSSLHIFKKTDLTWAELSRTGGFSRGVKVGVSDVRDVQRLNRILIGAAGDRFMLHGFSRMNSESKWMNTTLTPPLNTGYNQSAELNVQSISVHNNLIAVGIAQDQNRFVVVFEHKTTEAPTTSVPTSTPTRSPTTLAPSPAPTDVPTLAPTAVPSFVPTSGPTRGPTSVNLIGVSNPILVNVTIDSPRSSTAIRTDGNLQRKAENALFDAFVIVYRERRIVQVLTRNNVRVTLELVDGGKPLRRLLQLKTDLLFKVTANATRIHQTLVRVLTDWESNVSHVFEQRVSVEWGVRVKAKINGFKFKNTTLTTKSQSIARILPIELPTLFLLSYLAFFIFLTVIAILHSNRSRQSDLIISRMSGFIFLAYDFTTDIILALTIFSEGQPIIFTIATVFILLPFCLSLYAWYVQKQKWKDSNSKFIAHYTKWDSKYDSVFMLASVICGSTFGAVLLFNSGLFDLDLFQMGIPRHELDKFQSRRLEFTIFPENIPQLIIQIVWATILAREKTVINVVVILAILTSVISIIMGIYRAVGNFQRHSVPTYEIDTAIYAESNRRHRSSEGEWNKFLRKKLKNSLQARGIILTHSFLVVDREYQFKQDVLRRSGAIVVGVADELDNMSMFIQKLTLHWTFYLEDWQDNSTDNLQKFVLDIISNEKWWEEFGRRYRVSIPPRWTEDKRIIQEFAAHILSREVDRGCLKKAQRLREAEVEVKSGDGIELGSRSGMPNGLLERTSTDKGYSMQPMQSVNSMERASSMESQTIGRKNSLLTPTWRRDDTQVVVNLEDLKELFAGYAKEINEAQEERFNELKGLLKNVER